MSVEASDLDGLNFALHGATLHDLRLDTASRVVSIPFTSATLMKDGQSAGPLELVLEDVTAVVLTLRDKDGNAPAARMNPIELEQLGESVRRGHELVGFDFLDSKRDTYPSGQLLYEWFLADQSAAHVLNFYFGMASPEGVSALLFYWIFFGSAKLLRQDGTSLAIEAFTSSSQAWKAASRTGKYGELVRVLPNPAPIESVNGQLLALLFVDQADTIRGHAVGRAELLRDGRLRWTARDGVRHVIPEEVVRDIRPRLADMSILGESFGAFSFFATVRIRKGDPADPRDVMKSNLLRERLWDRLM